MEKLNGLDLFSGYGGLTLALREWIKPKAYCEINRYAQSILLSRMSDGEIELAPIWDDVRTLDGATLGTIHAIYGGFPCQPFSVAGAKKGMGDERGTLFLEITRLAKETSCEFIFLENVPGIRTAAAERVGKELASMGYDCRWGVISAESVGAPFEGKRWFLLAKARGARNWYASEQGWRYGKSWKGSTHAGGDWENVAQTNGDRCKKSLPLSARFKEKGFVTSRNSARMATPTSERQEGWQVPLQTWESLREHRHSGPEEWPQWLSKPGLPHKSDGPKIWVERIESSGNGVVPLQARAAFEILAGLKK